MSTRGDQRQQGPVAALDLTREVCSFVALFVTIYGLGEQESDLPLEKQKQTRRRKVEDVLRERGQQLGFAKWLLRFFPAGQNHCVQKDLTLEKICRLAQQYNEHGSVLSIRKELRARLRESEQSTKELEEQKKRFEKELKRIGQQHNISNDSISPSAGGQQTSSAEAVRDDFSERASTEKMPTNNVVEETSPSGSGHVDEDEIKRKQQKLIEKLEEDIEQTEEDLGTEKEDIRKYESDLTKTEPVVQDRYDQFNEGLEDWFRSCRVEVGCSNQECRRKCNVKKFIPSQCESCNDVLISPEGAEAPLNGLYEELNHLSETVEEEALQKLWLAEAEALDYINSFVVDRCTSVSPSEDAASTVVGDFERSLKDGSRTFRESVASISKKEMRKSGLAKIVQASEGLTKDLQAEINRIRSSIHDEKEQKKKKGVQFQERVLEIKEYWSDYEARELDPTHPMLHLCALNEGLRDCYGGNSEFLLLRALHKEMYHQDFDDLELEEILELSESEDTKARLRLMYNTLECIEEKVRELGIEINEVCERTIKVFCDGIFKKDIKFMPILTVQAGYDQKLITESKEPVPVASGRQIERLGYQIREAVNGNSSVSEKLKTRNLRIAFPKKARTLSSVASKLIPTIKENCGARDTLKDLCQEPFCKSLESSELGAPEQSKIVELVAYLITYVDDDRSGRFAVSLIVQLLELLRLKGLSLETDNGSGGSVEKQRPLFLESDVKNPRAFLLRFLKVDEHEQKTVFESPFFECPKKLSDGLVGLLAGKGFWFKIFRESGGDHAAATLENVFKMESKVLEEPTDQHRHGLSNAVLALLRSLLQWRSQVRQQDFVGVKVQERDVDDTVQEILEMASNKYSINLRPDSSEYRDLCNQRVELDDLEHFEIERVPSEVIDKPRFTLCEFGVGERKAKLKAEVPPVKELGSHLEFFVDEAVWDSLNSLDGLDLSFRSAKLQHLYEGKNEQLEQLWKRVQKWYGNADSGRKWVGDQIMLMQSEWHPLFKHLIAERKFTLAADRPDFTDRFRNFFESAFEIVGRGNQDVGAIRDWMIDRFVDPDGVSETPDRELVAVFHLLKGQGPCRLFVQLLNDVGIELKGWSQFKGRKYQDLDQQETEQIERKVFQEGTQLGELFLEDLSLDEEGQIKPLVAVSVGPPVPEWSRLIESLNTTSEKGVSCDEVTSFLRKDLPSAKIRGDAHMRQAVQTLFRKLTDVLVESDLSHEDEDLVYEAVDAYFKQEMSMELFWPNSKRDFGSEWDHWLEIEEDSGGQEFDCRIPGLRDRDSDRPLFRARGNVN
ncbi:hypothetical protein N8510_00640 [bacterium]|nr:hypothetical protein [bacterium]